MTLGVSGLTRRAEVSLTRAAAATMGAAMTRAAIVVAREGTMGVRTKTAAQDESACVVMVGLRAAVRRLNAQQVRARRCCHSVCDIASR